MEVGENLKILYESVERKVDSLNEKEDKVNELFENYDDFVRSVEELDGVVDKAQELYLKINALNKGVLTRKNEIDELYYEIMGYTETDEVTKEETVIYGLKDKLENSYNELNENLRNISNEIKEYQKVTTENYSQLVEDRKNSFKILLEGWKKDYDLTLKQICDLLPDALTSGLSHAYIEKRKAEIIEQTNLSNKFTKAIWGLIGVSLIPFAVSIVSLFTGKSFHDVILDIPRVVLSILPLYVPVMWVAYSSDKKIKLSKRLIEEYTHKEVLSKTFEGLSSQIKDLEDDKISEELRIKLLYNILEVSSENPGKLISDYNKSDHPLMDALDKSAKLAIAVERLAKIPGFSRMAATLEKKSRTLLNEKARNVEGGLSALEEEIDNEGDRVIVSKQVSNN